MNNVILNISTYLKFKIKCHTQKNAYMMLCNNINCYMNSFLYAFCIFNYFKVLYVDTRMCNLLK